MEAGAEGSIATRFRCDGMEARVVEEVPQMPSLEVPKGPFAMGGTTGAAATPPPLPPPPLIGVVA